MGEEAPKGGDAGKDAEPPQPVVLRMVLHCDGCAKKVKKSIRRMPGVESVVADAASNRVVVAGTADAAALKARIEAKTKKAVEIVSAGGVPKEAAAESKADKDRGGGGGKKKADKDGGGEKKGDNDIQPKEEKEKKQPPEEQKPKEAGTQEETVLIKIRLHCAGCADRIRRRIYKIKGVKDVELDSNAKDEVKVTGTMDVASMLVYLSEKLNRTVEAVAPGKKDGDKKDKGGDGEKKKDIAAAAGDANKDKGKSVEVAGPSTVAAAASMAPPPAEAITHHVSPYGYVAYPQQQGPPASYYHYYGGNADGVGHANPNAAPYHHHHPGANAAPYYHHPVVNADPNPQPYPPYPYGYDMAPAPQMFSDENPNACSVM